MEKQVEQQFEAVGKLIDVLVEFAVAYGFQLFGPLVVLVIGLKIAGWTGRRVTAFAVAKEIDETLAKFIGGIVKLVVVGFVIIITLGNFGISIAPLIALAGAAAFGATLALQGPLSNYGAGLSIILTRPFVVGDTVAVQGSSGVVDVVTLAHTVLVGEDGERITVPNKEIVGQVIVNSERRRLVETKIAIAQGEDTKKAIAVLRDVFGNFPEIADPDDGGDDSGDDSAPAPQVGIHDFTFEACSDFTRVTARWIAQPPKATFVTRLRNGQLPDRPARQLPDQPTTLWVASSSTGVPRLRGALSVHG